jgi:hypothetical protein
MTWYTFTVTPIVHGDLVAAHLLHMANDAAMPGRVRSGAAVFRRKHDNAEQFFVTPAAIDLFAPFIETYGGKPCEPPQTQDLLSLDLSRLRVEERVRWEVMASRDRPGESLLDEEPDGSVPALGT